MRPIIILFTFPLFFAACKQQDSKLDEKKVAKADSVMNKPAMQVFFPVTDYIKGQIFDIKSSGINPLKINKANGHTDSTWIKMETLEMELADFLLPVIDSMNMTSLFSEKKFMDQTLDAITLTYDPINALPGSFALQHWDVYIDPNTDLVKRIYLLKKLPADKTQQLTWNSGKGCRMITFINGADNSYTIEKEITLTWRF